MKIKILLLSLLAVSSMSFAGDSKIADRVNKFFTPKMSAAGLFSLFEFVAGFNFVKNNDKVKECKEGAVLLGSYNNNINFSSIRAAYNECKFDYLFNPLDPTREENKSSNKEKKSLKRKFKFALDNENPIQMQTAITALLQKNEALCSTSKTVRVTNPLVIITIVAGLGYLISH